MTNKLEKYIQDLKIIDEGMYSLFTKKRELQPDFKICCDYNYVFDVECRYLFVSLFSKAQHGLTPDIMIGEHWRELDITNKNMVDIEQAVRSVVTTGKEIKKELLDVEKAIKRYFEYTFSPFLNENNCITAVTCNVRDITERKILAMNEWDYLSRLNWLIDMSPTAIIIVDKDGNLVNANQLFIESLFPIYSKDDLIGKNKNFLKENTGLDWKHSPCYQALQGKDIRNLYISILEHDLLINASPIKNHDGTIIGALAAFNDITDYETLRKEIARLDRLNLIGEMAAGVAHEIRNPLTVVKGFLQYVQKRVTQEVETKIDLILDELTAIESIVTDFLSLAQSKQTNLYKQNLNNIIKSIYPMVAAEANKRCIDIKLELDDRLPDILLDDKEIRQLLLNLVRNGVEAIESKGVLSIVTKHDKNSVLLTCNDNGKGIPEDVCQNIFTPFFTTKDNGTGLGLSICASIVERHGGRISVKSKVGLGTKFIIKFPV